MRMLRISTTTTNAMTTSWAIRPAVMSAPVRYGCRDGTHGAARLLSLVRPHHGGGAADLHHLHGLADRQHLQRIVGLGGPLLARQLDPPAVLVHRPHHHRVTALEPLD